LITFAQDKTQFSTSRLPWYFLSKYSSQRPHELLGQFVKERLSHCSIKVAYSTSSRRLVNRLIKESSNSFSLILSNSCPS
ncbi:hypothetical protein, partial [Marinobacter sp.]|uniref:hypothetical protein n=1 Tax=Marinobacter sp. TaxID=50741 RepID=UPI003A8FB99F